MASQLIARELGSGFWQWAELDDNGSANYESLSSGDTEQLLEALRAPSQIINVAMRGQQIVSTELAFDAKQKKHAAKLIPYELEDELSSPVDDVHFSFGQIEQDRIPVLYADMDACNTPINALDTHGLDVRVALPDYLMLRWQAGSVTLVLEQEILTMRVSEHWGFSIEADLAPTLLQRVSSHSALKNNPPQHILLIAKDEHSLATVESWLPEIWLQEGVEIDRENGDFWTSLKVSSEVNSLNLRRGRLARKLPISRWWKLWQAPVIFLSIAFILAVVVNVGDYYSAKTEAETIRDEMNQVYLKAVPNGRLGDPERVLESMLRGAGKASVEPSNFVYLLSKVTEVLGDAKTTSLSSYSYSGEQRSLQLTLEFETLAALGEFRSALQELGIASEPPRTNSVGEAYQARLKVKEAQ